MSFRPITSCGDYHYIARCPDNGLPLFKNFSQQDISSLTRILDRDKKTIMALPVWLASYHIAKELTPDAPDLLDYLIFSFWYESEDFLAEPEWRMVLINQYELHKADMDNIKKILVETIIAYASLLGNDHKNADKFLALARQTPLDDSFIETYLGRVESCARKWDEAACAGDIEIEHLSEIKK